jgi:hypothetical protein
MSEPRFEYTTLQVKPGFLRMAPDPEKLTAELNRLGAQGWELTAPLPTPGNYPSRITLIFKRPR